MEDLIIFIALMTVINFIAIAMHGWIFYRFLKYIEHKNINKKEKNNRKKDNE